MIKSVRTKWINDNVRKGCCSISLLQKLVGWIYDEIFVQEHVYSETYTEI